MEVLKHAQATSQCAVEIRRQPPINHADKPTRGSCVGFTPTTFKRDWLDRNGNWWFSTCWMERGYFQEGAVVLNKLDGKRLILPGRSGSGWFACQ
jgi:hypothetical protein